MISTYNAGPFVAGVGARSLQPARPLPHPGRHGQYRAAAGGGQAAQGRRRWPARRPMRCTLPNGRGSAASTCAASSIARIMVAGEPGGGEPAMRAQAGGGVGRQGLRGDGHRRHLGLAVGRVRGTGRHAFQRPRLRAFRADRPGERRGRSPSPTARRANSSTLISQHEGAPLLRFRTRDHVVVWTGAVPLAAARRRACAASAAPTT